MKAAPANVLPALSSPLQTDRTQARDAKAWKAATDFEAMTIDQMIQPMFDTIDHTDSDFDGGVGEQSFRPMLIDEMAKEMERAGGLGMADTLYRQMLAMQEKK
ncbi:chemotactic signal-response protein CheL [Ameyamaea chiangmaiensis NBRC 103196]|uniref:Rod-binding protein n=1 Tax=Ameyamaea chiangmaiensis TaxID=442969 RepID=A0A850P6X9_9PROT|nr:rod-binding protein [Ameyamaea chiangmaiensis]MBS4075616.1 rod-binding protein [Ameyamaea chiangmaiensis]NVN40367.1 rod-binding protein [Ameyamaea chiangmaiensis]GBQ70745.1 chemotactic signal-response protein CheL [Ameyamaea chiangmaiensis NBRC 103196]